MVETIAIAGTRPRFPLRSGLLLALLLLGATAAAAEYIPREYVQLGLPDGQIVGEVLFLDGIPVGYLQEEMVLIRSGEGEQATLSFKSDSDRGLFWTRLTDRTSGWWIEHERDTGLRKGGGPADFPDPWQWHSAMMKRGEEEQPLVTLRLTTSDGASVTWVQSWGMEVHYPQAAEQARVAALADLREQVTEVPASALRIGQIVRGAAASASRALASISNRDPLELILDTLDSGKLPAMGPLIVDVSRPVDAADRVEVLMKALPK